MAYSRGNGPRAVVKAPVVEVAFRVTVRCLIGEGLLMSRTYEVYPSIYLAAITRQFEEELVGYRTVEAREEFFYAFGPRGKKVTKDKKKSFKANGLVPESYTQKVDMLAFVAVPRDVGTEGVTMKKKKLGVMPT
ncbi:hypothetical protein TWF281_004759 [Arthrobotrys megalospora]